MPVRPVINMLFFGALLGLLLDFLVKKLKKPCIASMLTGVIFFDVISIGVAIIAGSRLWPWFTGLLSKYIGMP